MENLNFEQMENINGGVSRAEYCGTLDMLVTYNWSSWNDHQRESWCNAWYTHCAAYYDQY